jgi:hypothetical protein
MPIGETGQWTFSVSQTTLRTNTETANGLWVEHAPLPLEEAEDGTVVLGTSSAASQHHGYATFDRFASALVDITRLLTKEGRNEVLAELQAADPTLSRTTFYKVLRRWLEGGMTPLALQAKWKGPSVALDLTNLEDIDAAEAVKACKARSLQLQQEGKPERKNVDATARGVPRKRAAPAQPTLYEVDRYTLRVLLTYYKTKMAQRSMSLASAYELMRREVFSTAQVFGPEMKWPLWAIPSFVQFKHYWRELVSHKARTVSERGAHRYELEGRELARSVSAAYAAGRIGELDATVWNVELVGDGDDAPIIGPPIVFRVRCKDTGQLLGLSVSLENASWNGAASAIINCLEDKLAFCKRIGLTDEDLALRWDTRGLCTQFDVDQGETYNHKPRRFMRLTGVSISTMPRARGDMKPGVESDWNTLQVGLNEMTPGAIIKAYEEERGIKWHMKASMTLRQFTQMLVLHELRRMYTPRMNIHLPREMVRANGNTSPNWMFRWSLRNGGGGLKLFDETAVRLSLLPVENATVDERGLSVRGIHFKCEPLRIAEAHAKARAQGRRTVRVCIDPLLVDSVWLIQGDEEAPTSYVRSTLDMRLPEQRSYKGRTWREVLNLRESTNVTNRNELEEVNHALAVVTAKQDKIAQEAIARREAARKQFPTNEARLIAGRKSEREVAKNQTSPALAITAPLQPIVEQTVAQVVPITQAHAKAVPTKRSRFSRLVQQFQSDSPEANKRPANP